MEIIFETKRLLVRKLKLDDLEPFHEMQSNINVMKFVRFRAMTFEENKNELIDLIAKYDSPTNDFWIYGVERKSDSSFVGTIALVKDANNEDEIGYRFLEKYWNNGFGKEIVQGLVNYCKRIGFNKLIACVAHKNTASAKIIKQVGFEFVEDFISEDLKIPETKYMLEL